MAVMMRNGSYPDATASGSGASGKSKGLRSLPIGGPGPDGKRRLAVHF